MSNVVSLTINGMNISHKLDKYAYKDGHATIGAIANERKVVELVTDETVVIAEYLGELSKRTCWNSSRHRSIRNRKLE